MKLTYFFTLLFAVSIFTTTVTAQQSPFLQRLSLEAGAGFNFPSSSSHDDVSASDFAGFGNFYVGANYELTNTVGLRFTYANTSFTDKDDSSLGLTHHKFMAEATFNIIEWIEMERTPFEVVVHGGVGGSLGKSKLTSGLDKMGTLQFGLMPMYRITNNISIHADATYVINLRQNYFYNGRQSSSDNSHVTGEYFMVNLGLGLRFDF